MADIDTTQELITLEGLKTFKEQYKANISDKKQDKLATYDLPRSAKSLSGVDLDTLTYTSAGFYYAGGSNKCTNVPSGIDAFGLQVMRVAAGWTAQLLIPSNAKKGQMYLRIANGSTWNSWVEVTKDNNTTYSTATTSANGLMSSTDKTKLNGIATGAEVNQNAFANITVGSTTIAADAKQDTVTLAAGSNITLTPDATNDKITIAATNTTYSAATTSAAGLMSASDKTKLNGIATGATKITVDSALSTTSTNPVQNKVITNRINNLVDTMDIYEEDINTNADNISTNTTNISNLTTKVASMYTKTEVNNLIANLKKATMQIVTSLPTTGEEGIIYLVGSASPYEMYIYESSSFVDLGSTNIDLSDYYTQEEVDDLLDSKQNTLANSSKLVRDTTVTLSSGSTVTQAALINYTGGIPVYDTTTTQIYYSGKTFSTAAPSSSSTDNEIPTAKAVYTAISAIDTSVDWSSVSANNISIRFGIDDYENDAYNYIDLEYTNLYISGDYSSVTIRDTSTVYMYSDTCLYLYSGMRIYFGASAQNLRFFKFGKVTLTVSGTVGQEDLVTVSYGKTLSSKDNVRILLTTMGDYTNNCALTSCGLTTTGFTIACRRVYANTSSVTTVYVYYLVLTAAL